MHRTTRYRRDLLEHGPVYEVVLMVNLVVLSTGKRIFAEGPPLRPFEL